ncbi:MAG: PAS domain S-box protein [Promethearchaeota archaeon]|nr:MAG: PAS domain S-box protein [Candidatus Lokiarchaeota archaeon]
MSEKEREFRDLLNNCPDLIYTFDIINCKPIYVNPSSEKVFGYSPEELKSLGLKDINQLIHPEDKKRLRKHIDKLLEQTVEDNISSTIEYRFNHKTYGYRWIRENRSLIYDDNNIPISIVCVARDINEHKQIEQKLKESEKKFREIFENIPDLFILVSGDTTILDFAGDREKFYMPPEKFIGKKMKDLLPPKHGILSLELVRKTIDTKQPNTLEYSLPLKRGVRYFEARNLYFPEEKIAIFIRDITERKVAEQKLRESEYKYRKAYEQANFYKNLFAHDMNNILNIIMLAEQLSSSNPEKLEDMKGYLELIREQIIRGTSLISNIQKLSQLEEFDISIESMEVCKVLNKAIQYLKKSFKTRNIDIHVDSISKNLFVRANYLLFDVFENILNNAVKYNDNSIVEIIINISEIQKDQTGYLKMEFKDNGTGIPNDHKELIFQRDYKKDICEKGMGIGLSLVKKIIETYNGGIWVEDKFSGDYTRGSNFIILIPSDISQNLE